MQEGGGHELHMSCIKHVHSVNVMMIRSRKAWSGTAVSVYKRHHEEGRYQGRTCACLGQSVMLNTIM